jgi:SagB-type dehydrogenase family enzyme
MKWINLESPNVRAQELEYQEFRYPILSRHYLSVPCAVTNPPFFAVTERRKSVRQFKSLTIDRLNALLWHAARSISLLPPQNGERWQHRPTPSAGGKHPVDVFVVDCSKKEKSVLLYSPVSHSLSELKIYKEPLIEFLQLLAEVLPTQNATIIWFGAQFERTLSKYENGESLIWRDAGALSATLAFTAEALEINCCLLGPTGEPFFSKIFGDNKTILGVGGMYVGER